MGRPGTVAMWPVLALLCLVPPGSSPAGALAEPRQIPPPARASAQGAPPKAPLPASALPARSLDPLLSLNLGLNFKIKVRSQGSFRPAGPSTESAPADLSPADPAQPRASASFLTPPSRLLPNPPPGSARSGDSSAPGEARSGDSSAPGEARSSDSSVPGEARSGDSSAPGEARSGDSSAPGEARSGDSSAPGEARSGDSSVPGSARSGDSSAPGEARSGDSSAPGEARSSDSSAPGEARSSDSSAPGEARSGDSSAPGEARSGDSSAPGEARSSDSSAPGSGWLVPGSAHEPSPDAAHGPGGWAEAGAKWNDSPPPRFRSSPWEPEFLEPSRQDALPPAAGQPTPASSPHGHSKGLEFKINIDLTAGLEQEAGTPPGHVLPAGGARGPGTGRKPPLLPSLRAEISELASKLGTASFFGPTVPPDWQQERRGQPGRNSTGGAWDQPWDTSPSPPRATEPGPAPARPGPSPGSGEALAAWPRCPPEKLEECGSPSPEPGAPPGPGLLPSLPLLVPLHADWNTAMATWGLAWDAHVYGAGSLFGLLALLALLSLACLACRCPAGCSLLAALELLLLVAGGARAFLLCYDAYGQQERLPAFASLLLHDLPFPCLSSALAVAFLPLAARCRARRSRLRPPGCLAALVLLHFCMAVGAVLAGDLLRPLPFLLLASRAAFALLAALLALAVLAFCCQGRAHGAPPPGEPLAGAWSRAARTTLLAAGFALLSAALQAYAILHALGYGLAPARFGPWPWWSLQLGCRLCEVGTGLPLALLGLYPVLCSPHSPRGPCWGALFCLPLGRSPLKAPLLPSGFQWAVAPHEKLGLGDRLAHSDSEFLPLYALAGGPRRGSAQRPGAWGTRLEGGSGSAASSVLSIATAGDPTADFRPPSPIDLRRSIDEALFGEALFPAGGLALSLHRAPGLGDMPAGHGPYRTASCLPLETAPPEGGHGQVSPAASAPAEAPNAAPSSPGSRSSSASEKLSLAGSSLALCPSPENPPQVSSAYAQALPRGESSPCRSPPPPGGPYLPLAQPSQESLDSLAPPPPAGETAGLQDEFMDVCRQIDALSVSSDTIDL